MINLIDLTNKTVVITGASSGIGRATAILFSKLGATLALIGRREEQLKQTLELMEGNGHEIFVADILDTVKVEETIAEVVAKMGKISGFVHSAGVEMTKPLKMLKPQAWQDVFAINVFAGFEIAKSITKSQHLAETSSIVFIASIVGSHGQAGKIAYSSSKGALIAGSKSMALEFAGRKVRVNTISPALVETDMSKEILNKIGDEARENVLKMHPLGFGKAEDIANACAYFVSDASAWITGTDFIIDGGYSAS